MKSMQDNIPKKKKAKKGKLAKKRCKGKRKAKVILEDTSEEDDFANSTNE